jgi:hypothetical protein
MKDWGRIYWLGVGLALGIAGTIWLRTPPPPPVWAGNDRHDDYIMCTGPIALTPQVTGDGVWLLDFRAGKLLGTIVDRTGRIAGWEEVDLVKEFNIPPKQNVHFLMTTGTPIAGNTALYLTEINTGRFGIYTMGTDRRIRRHDATMFRKAAPAEAEK